MKLKILFFLLALLAATTIKADPPGFIVQFTDVKTLPNNGGGNPRSPIVYPVFYLDGYTLTASDNTLGSTVRLIDENDNVVFTTYVTIEGDIQLPATLSGTYTIEVTRGNWLFIGEIEL